MTTARSPTLPAEKEEEEEEEDSEWEYEYHETETEDFYIMLDLSSHTKHFAQGIKPPPSVSASKKPTAPANEVDSNGDGNSTSQIPTDAKEPALDSFLSTPAQEQKRIQIADLHSYNPLISYKSQLYSCEWTTALGTDMLFTATEPRTQPRPQSQRDSQATTPPPQPTATLIAATRIKLSACPIQVSPRPQSEISSLAATSASAGANPISTSTNTGTPLIPLPPTAKPDRQNQAAFLTNLINIKRAKGEMDEVNVYGATQRPYGQRRRESDANAGAGGGSSLKGDDDEKEGEEEEEEDGPWIPPEESATTRGPAGGRGRGARARSTTRARARSRARARGRGTGRTGRRQRGGSGASGMGLFQDHQPGVVDEGEMATAAMASTQKTPARWEDLGMLGGENGDGIVARARSQSAIGDERGDDIGEEEDNGDVEMEDV